MRINHEYNDYYIYSAVYRNGRQTNFGACPVVWENDLVLQGGRWNKGLTWADGNYHLYGNDGLPNEDALFVEECIYTALNEAEETHGKIDFDGSDYSVRWCLLEEDQMRVVMDLPE